MRHLRPMLRWLPCFAMLSLALAGCGSPPPPPLTKLVVPEVPASLQTCSGDPTPPDPKTATQRDAAAYLEALWGAWYDCHGTVDSLTKFWQDVKTETAK